MILVKVNSCANSVGGLPPAPVHTHLGRCTTNSLTLRICLLLILKRGEDL